jgi:hypothetical protein|tara:strand:+ start:349 stop:558 length:210 start_codon:yes stop_codon:yes gene_type:complete
MLCYLYKYCEHFGYSIKENIIYDNDNAIGHVNSKENWVIIGKNKLKYGDFALLIAEGYFDITGDDNDCL